MQTRWLAVLVSVLALAAARAEAQPTIAGPIRIGIVGPFSGRSAEAGERVASAVKMAIEEQNAAGGILGAKVEAVIGDDEGVPEKSTLLAQRLVDDPLVLGVIGPMNSGAVLATGGIYERGVLPFITPTATNARLTEQGWKVAHRTAGRDDREGPASAVFIAEELRPKKVLLISDKTAFQTGIVQEVLRILKQRGVADATIEEVSDQDRDLTPLVTRTKASGADFVYIGVGAQQAALFLKQAAQGGLRIRGLGNGSLRDKEAFIKAAGGEAEGIYVSYNAQDPRLVPEAKDFVAKFEAKYKKSVSAYEPQAYDATMILMNAIKTAGARGGKVNRADVLAAIKATRDYRGVLGIPITFDAKGDIAAAPINIFRVEGGDFVRVKTVVP
ncbi:MAG TPA: branched-chain amino acid ABC transporter substrate-binding protein [Methylomirabilota bacterium]|jgi:branched-chain amino acid transport system substrate-binding protein|nr:branched-chain amino acid ABC transporter substrate-binding protein [Methylomirabilota bacterium]